MGKYYVLFIACVCNGRTVCAIPLGDVVLAADVPWTVQHVMEHNLLAI